MDPSEGGARWECLGSQSVEIGLLIGHPSLDEIAIEIGQVRPEQCPVAIDVVAARTDADQVFIEHLGHPSLQAAVRRSASRCRR